jgi:hypothetical protein
MENRLEEGQAFFAVVGLVSKEKISAALIFKSPLPLLKYTYITDAICFPIRGGGTLCRFLGETVVKKINFKVLACFYENTY